MPHRRKGKHHPRHHTHAVKPASISDKKPLVKAPDASVTEPTAPQPTETRPVETEEVAAP